MSAKYFILYGNTTITAHIADDVELMAWASRDDSEFKPALYDTLGARVSAADRILLAKYKVWGLFEYTPEGMAEFMEAAAQADELTGIHAMQIAEEYVQEAQKALAVALTEAQQKAMDRVQFPIAGDKPAFQKYQEKISDIRDFSINALYEYVENGDETPE